MMRCWMVFCPVVRIVRGAQAPEKVKLFLTDAEILQPVEVHVHGFGAFWLDPFVDNAFGGGIVDLQGGGWLRVSHRI